MEISKEYFSETFTSLVKVNIIYIKVSQTYLLENINEINIYSGKYRIIVNKRKHRKNLKP